MNEKTTKNIELRGIAPFSGLYGTMNKFHPSVVYAKVKVKVEPREKRTNYSDDVMSFKAKVGRFLGNELFNAGWITEKYLYRCEMTERNLEYGKKSNFKYEFFINPVEVKEIASYEGEIADIVERVNGYASREFAGMGMELSL